MRLIDADHLRKWIIINWHNTTLDDILDQIDREDSYFKDADIVDVEPIRHGHWMLYEYGDYHWYKCSVCGVVDKIIETVQTVHGVGYSDKYVESTRHYCPWCGAKMDEVEKDEISDT